MSLWFGVHADEGDAVKDFSKDIFQFRENEIVAINLHHIIGNNMTLWNEKH